MNNSKKLMVFRNTRYVKFFRKCENIIDLGCGDGHFVECANKIKLKCMGIDLSPKTKNPNIVKGNALRTNFKNEEFDGVFSSHLIEHLTPGKENFDFLDEVYRISKTNSIIMLITPVYKNWFWEDPTHVRPYNRGGLYYLLQNGYYWGRKYKFKVDKVLIKTREIPLIQGLCFRLNLMPLYFWLLEWFPIGKKEYVCIAHKIK